MHMYIIRKAEMNLQTDGKLIIIRRAITNCVPHENINLHFYGKESFALL